MTSGRIADEAGVGDLLGDGLRGGECQRFDRFQLPPQCNEKFLDANACLFQNASERAGLEFAVVWYNATCCTTPHNHVAAGWRTTTKLKCSSARTTSAPETCGNLGRPLYLKRRD